MANHSATKKSIRQNEKRTARNRHFKSQVKTSVRKLDDLLKTSATPEDALAALRHAESVMMKVASKGIIKKKTASRRISRLSKKVKAL